MAETPPGEVIVGHFDNVFRPNRLPFRRSFCRPSAGTARGITRKAPIIFYGLELYR